MMMLTTVGNYLCRFRVLAENGAINKYFDTLALWRKRAANVEGQTVSASHYMAEEIPDELVSLVQPFLQANL